MALILMFLDFVLAVALVGGTTMLIEFFEGQPLAILI